MKHCIAIAILALFSLTVCNAQISAQYPALKDSAYLDNPVYQQGNKYQRDAMLFIDMLSDTHPYYIRKVRRDSLLRTVPEVLDECSKCDSDTAFTQILYRVLGKLHDKHTDVIDILSLANARQVTKQKHADGA